MTISSTAGELLASKEGLCLVDLASNGPDHLHLSPVMARMGSLN
jgi:hypothetical protein